MGIDTEYDEDPMHVTQSAGQRSNNVLELHLGERTMSSLARMAFVAGICATTSLVCLIGLWAVYTQTQIIKDGYNRVRVQVQELQENQNAVHPARSE